MKTKTIGGIAVETLGPGKEWGPRITREEAERLLRLGETLPGGLPFNIRAKGFGMSAAGDEDEEDEDGGAAPADLWAAVYFEDMGDNGADGLPEEVTEYQIEGAN